MWGWWNWDKFFSEFFDFPLSILFHRVSILIYQLGMAARRHRRQHAETATSIICNQIFQPLTEHKTGILISHVIFSLPKLCSPFRCCLALDVRYVLCRALYLEPTG
jgi:hypothetical protein